MGVNRAITPGAQVFFVCGALALFAGCASESGSHLVTAPPPAPPTTQTSLVTTTSTPTMVTTQTTQNTPTGTMVTTQSQPGSTVVVTQAPPVLQQEVPPPRPSTDHVWVGGYWTWRDSQYQWAAGHWVIPPRSGATWVPPRWQPEGNAWRFFDGSWE